MDASKDENEKAVDGFEPLPDEQEQPAEPLPQSPSKPSYAFVAVLTTLLLAYTDQSLTGGTLAIQPATPLTWILSSLPLVRLGKQ